MSVTSEREPGSFGEYLAKVRQEKGLTQSAFAKKAALSLALISKMERSETDNPSFETVCQLAEGLGVPPADLVVAHHHFDQLSKAPAQ
jgi:transcriptional regulator with XRE-family HTH domain